MQVEDKISADFLTDLFIKKMFKMDALTEVRFREFTADIFFIKEKKRRFVGVEVKGDGDSLSRLKSQLRGYLKYFHSVYVLCSPHHLKGVLKVVGADEFSSVGVIYYENGEFIINKNVTPVEKITGVNSNWVSKNHKLYQYKWLIDEVWGYNEQ